MLPLLLMMAHPYYQSYLQPKISIISKGYPFMANWHRTKEWHCFQERSMVNLAYSDNINIWREAKLIQKPKYPWDLIQVGNSGSPIETEEGWLIITHGVGPMREYLSLIHISEPTRLGMI